MVSEEGKTRGRMVSGVRSRGVKTTSGGHMFPFSVVSFVYRMSVSHLPYAMRACRESFVKSERLSLFRLFPSRGTAVDLLLLPSSVPEGRCTAVATSGHFPILPHFCCTSKLYQMQPPPTQFLDVLERRSIYNNPLVLEVYTAWP